MSVIPGVGKFPGGGNGNALQYSCLENSIDRGAWQATVHEVTKESGMTEQLSARARTHTRTPPTHTHTEIKEKEESMELTVKEDISLFLFPSFKSMMCKQKMLAFPRKPGTW